MEVSQDSSHFIKDSNFSSPALSSSRLDNFDPYELTRPSSPNLPATPSYNGSYQNSPYTSYSDIDFDNSNYLDDLNREYDPSDYDAPGPNSHSNLLSFEADYISTTNPPVSVSVTPPTVDPQYESTFDHSSPGSSNGHQDESDSRSRASSVSSNSHYLPSSPPMEVTRGFESLRFESPQWNSSNLPVDRPSPPANKPSSPPQLFIPDSTSPNQDIMHDRTPVINAPDGDGGVLSGPQLNVVPATPVSGAGPQAAPFLSNTIQGSSPPTWNTEAAPATNTFERAYPDNNNLVQSSGLGHLLYPQQPRIRSKSDTASRPPTWDFGSVQSISPPRPGINLTDILPPTSPQPEQPHTEGYTSYSNAGAHPPLLNHFSYPGTSDSRYLSPNAYPAPEGLRRARSDAGRPSRHRYSRSEGGIVCPPSSHTDFIARTTSMMHQQFLHPTEMVPNITRGHHRRSSSGSRDRGIPGSTPLVLQSAPGSTRTSPYPSPSASPALNYEPLPPVPSTDVHDATRNRSPLPVFGGAPLGFPVGGISSAAVPLNDSGRPSDLNSTSAGIPVSKQNVTTTATAEASERRRKTDATFVCPVPGCGSTFTRHFNLKGHLRSHNEEKPYQCKWPGCGKGFARAHDCKRHEQLHYNYRPHKCEGCGKSFQRMDALNRHLRSEGGQDCQRLQDEVQASGGLNSSGLMSDFSSSSVSSSAPAMFGSGIKAEPDNWGMGVMM